MLEPILQKDNVWHIPNNGFQSTTSPAVNIHHTGQRHWVMSFQYESDEDVYLLESDIGIKSSKLFDWLIKNPIGPNLWQWEEANKSKYPVYNNKTMVMTSEYLLLQIFLNLLLITMVVWDKDLCFSFYPSWYAKTSSQMFCWEKHTATPKEEIKGW